MTTTMVLATMVGCGAVLAAAPPIATAQVAIVDPTNVTGGVVRAADVGTPVAAACLPNVEQDWWTSLCSGMHFEIALSNDDAFPSNV